LFSEGIALVRVKVAEITHLQVVMEMQVQVGLFALVPVYQAEIKVFSPFYT